MKKILPFKDPFRQYFNTTYKLFCNNRVITNCIPPNESNYKGICNLISQLCPKNISKTPLNVLEIGAGNLPTLPILKLFEISVKKYVVYEAYQGYKTLNTLLKTGKINGTLIEIKENIIEHHSKKYLKPHQPANLVIFMGPDFYTTQLTLLQPSIEVIQTFDSYKIQKILLDQLTTALANKGYAIIGFHSPLEYTLYKTLIKTHKHIKIIKEISPESPFEFKQNNNCSGLLLQKTKSTFWIK